MKTFRLTITFLFSVVILFSCGDDDDKGPKFADQPLQGIINGQEWQAASGTAEPDSFDDNELSINITELQIADVCNEFLVGGLRVFFSIPDKVGVYELSLESQSITLFDPDESLNVIVTDGTVEIQSIDTSEGGLVTGRIAGDFDKENFVNGNFSVNYCPQ